MITKTNNNERELDITELPTDEYPILSEAALAMAHEAAESNGAAAAPIATRDEPVRAALSLTHLEAEVSRLHAKWQSIDAEFRNRETLIGGLKEEIQARDDAIAKLTGDLERGAAAQDAVNEQLKSKDAEIAALGAEQRARDERIEALSKELADAADKHEETLEKLASAEAETARLADLVAQEQATVANLTAGNRQAQAEHEGLQQKLQDLEIYINGRHDRWAELNAELAALKDALRDKEGAITTRDAIIASHDEEKRQLTASIHDLERQCSELVGRRKEREEAHDELQKKLASQLAQAEQLKGEYASKTKETEEAAKRAADTRLKLESLEHGTKERDARIEALSTEVAQSKAALGELETAKADLRKRVGELEKDVAERAAQLEALRDDLRKSHERERLTQDQLADRAAELTATNDALDRKSTEADRLTAERDAAQKESARMRAELETLGAHANELGKLRAAAAAEAKELQTALAARNEQVLKLETDLRVKQATADLLERSVGRISDLGASLAALDERMNGGAAKRGAAPSTPQTVDLAGTLAADDGSKDDAAHVDIGEPTNIEAWRKLVVTVGGQTFDYPISKKQMTIGRGHESDIRVASHFVSRIHAKIRTNGTATIIEDAGSKNGVLVNSERVLRRVLRNGDIVTLGDDLNMRFVDATH